MLEVVGFIALCYFAFRFAGSILGVILRGLLIVISMILLLPVLVWIMQLAVEFSIRFWSAFL